MGLSDTREPRLQDVLDEDKEPNDGETADNAMSGPVETASNGYYGQCCYLNTMSDTHLKVANNL